MKFEDKTIRAYVGFTRAMRREVMRLGGDWVRQRGGSHLDTHLDTFDGHAYRRDFRLKVRDAADVGFRLKLWRRTT